MAAQFDDFLTSLRTQIVRVADDAAAGREPAPTSRPAAAPRPWHVRPKIALAFIIGVLAPAAAVAVAVILSSGGGVDQPVVSDVGTAAYVQPVEGTPSASQGTAPRAAYSLSAVAARSATDAWAVGSRRAVVGGVVDERSFVLHFDGQSWRETKTPDIGALHAVAVSSEGIAWALGARSDAILVWSGAGSSAAGGWTSMPSGAPAGATLSAVTALSANDAWAVGGSPAGPLALHYDGAAWTPAFLPATSLPGASLSSVSGSAAADVWAVGPDTSGRRGTVMHYDGAGWSAVSLSGLADTASPTVSPVPATDWPDLATVACVGPADVWVGGADLLHFDGAAWTEGSSSGAVSGAASVASANDIWIPAADGDGVLHYDGTAWSTLVSTELGAASATGVEIGGVAATPAGVVWVVGTTTTSAGEAPLILRGDGAGWRVVVDGVVTAGGQ